MRTQPSTSRDKVRAHRARLRRRGLRPIQIWVPDVRAPKFAREAHRQSLSVARNAHERDDQAFVDAVSDWPSERTRTDGNPSRRESRVGVIAAIAWLVCRRGGDDPSVDVAKSIDSASTVH